MPSSHADVVAGTVGMGLTSGCAFALASIPFAESATQHLRLGVLTRWSIGLATLNNLYLLVGELVVFHRSDPPFVAFVALGLLAMVAVAPVQRDRISVCIWRDEVRSLH